MPFHADSVPVTQKQRLSDLLALDSIDNLWEAVRLCAQLQKTEIEPERFSAIRQVLEEIGGLWESGPVDAAIWDRVCERLVPVLRGTIAGSERVGELSRTWVRLKQEEPFR